MRTPVIFVPFKSGHPSVWGGGMGFSKAGCRIPDFTLPALLESTILPPLLLFFFSFFLIQTWIPGEECHKHLSHVDIHEKNFGHWACRLIAREGLNSGPTQKNVLRRLFQLDFRGTILAQSLGMPSVYFCPTYFRL
eukprot:Gb_10792 [translate_table: standard]